MAASTFAQSAQIKLAGSWSPTHGFQERLMYAPMQWQIADLFGVEWLDFTPFTWGDPIQARSGGVGVFTTQKIAKNAWFLVGPELVVARERRPVVGVFFGLSIDIFGKD